MERKLTALCQRLATLNAAVILGLTVMAAVSGVLLAFYYEPTAQGAHQSLAKVATVVSNGNLVLALHDLTGNGLIGAALIQLVLMFVGRRFQPAWVQAWVSGIGLVLVAIALSWTAIILDWSQVGYWRFAIELRTVNAIPVIGHSLKSLLIGGAAVSTATVQRMYALHSYVLAGGAIALAAVHTVGVIWQRCELEDEWV